MTALETFRALLPKKLRKSTGETVVRFNNHQNPHVLDPYIHLPPPFTPTIPDTPMTASILTNKTNTYKVKTPTSTSMPAEYFVQWCGSTLNYVEEYTTEKKDPLKLDEKPLKRLLLKTFPWIIDVTEVRIKHKGDIRSIPDGAICFGPLEIHITVSPTHHTELMNPKIEKKVRDKLHEILLPLITCMYENRSNEKPSIIFSPLHSETILEYVE